MKKFMSLVAALMLCVGAQAQIVSSSSRSLKVENAPSTSLKYVRLGVGFMTFTGEDGENWNTKSKVGYDLSFGFQKPLANVNGLYWGMELGLGSRGFALDVKEGSDKYMLHNIRFSPFTFGYKYALTDDIQLDGHLGAFVSFDYAGKSKWENEDGEGDDIKLGDWEDEFGWDWNRFDAGMEIGVGVWYKRFNLDFTYRRGFIKPIEYIGEWVDDYAGYAGIDSKPGVYNSNFMLRLGIAF